MPELPEVETTKTSLAPLLGQKVSGVHVFQPKLRWPIPDDLNRLLNYSLQNVERRAKYLILTFVSPIANQSYQLIMHLGMSGSLQQYPSGTNKRKHDHLILLFKANDNVITQLHYHDPRRFGAVLWFKDYNDKLLNHLGPEPLSTDFDADYLYHFIQRTSDKLIAENEHSTNSSISNDKPSNESKNSKNRTGKRPISKPIKSVIMEQQVVVGVGNIYAAESLYLSGIHPSTPASELSPQQLTVLVTHIKAVLEKSIALGGSTLRDFTVASGQTGYFQQTLNVYGRQGERCPECDTILDNVKLNGRASVFCPTCQPL